MTPPIGSPTGPASTVEPATQRRERRGGRAGGRPPVPRGRRVPSPNPARRTTRPWLLLAPALIVLGGLLLAPLVRVVVISFRDMSGLRSLATGEAPFIGLDNYRDVLGSRRLWLTVLPNTVVVALLCVVITVVLGTLVALLLETYSQRVRGMITVCILAAWALPAVTGTYIWIWIFDPTDGVVSRIGQAVGLADGSENWFTNRYAFFVIVIINVVHHSFPFVTLTVLAGLLTIPQDMKEAAILDGANAWQRFWTITVPTLKPVFAVVTILSTIWDFKVFTQVYLMPGGSGANREVLNLGTWSYTQSFGQVEYGTGSAIAVILTVTLLMITAVYLRTLFREGEMK